MATVAVNTQKSNVQSLTSSFVVMKDYLKNLEDFGLIEFSVSSKYTFTRKRVVSLWSKIDAFYSSNLVQFDLKNMSQFFEFCSEKISSLSIYNSNLKSILQDFNDSHSRNKSEPESIFNYDTWFKLVPVEQPPQTHFFEFLKPSSQGLGKIIEFYKSFTPIFIKEGLTIMNKKLWPDLPQNGGPLKIPTLQTEAVLKKISLYSSLYWSDFAERDKIALWSLSTGFHDIVNVSEIRDQRNDTLLKNFLSDEVNAKRIIQVPCLPKKTVTAKYFCIKEHKIDVDGSPYIKDRYVSDCTKTNIYLSPPASNLKYTFKTADEIFKNYECFSWLQRSYVGSVIDKSSYYRSIPMLPSNLTYVSGSDGKFYIDLFLKMGQTYASAYAQMLSNVFDIIVNREFNGSLKSITLQDDSFVLGRCDINQVIKFNEGLGFKTNAKKTQANTARPSWSGFTFDLQEKRLELQEKRVEKLEVLVQEILVSSSVTRRKIASALGKIYSHRLLVLGLGLNFTTHTLQTRELLFSNSEGFKEIVKTLRKQWFYNQSEYMSERSKCAYKHFFDEKISISAQCKMKIRNELCFALEISRAKVPFSLVRERIFTLNSYQQSLDITEMNIVCTDASSKGWGIHVRFGDRDFALGGLFEESDIEKDINIKEMFALILGIMTAVYVDHISKKASKWVVLVDNNVSLAMAISKSTHIKSQTLARLTSLLSIIQFSACSSFTFDRIKSEENLISDFASRLGEEHNYRSGCMGLSVNDLLALNDL